MRIGLVVIVVLVAGCSSAPPDEPSVERSQPLYSGPPPQLDPEQEPVEIDHVPMDPVSGSMTTSGVHHEQCTAGGWGRLMTSWTTWEFEVGTNATSMEITADWAQSNPTNGELGIAVVHEDGLLGMLSGGPGLTGSVDVSGLPLDDRKVWAYVRQPACAGQAVMITYFEDVVVDATATFY